MSRKPSTTSFLRDVKDHQMVILHDDGVCRNIRFAKPDSFCMHFNVTTWPGCLCFSGDMGCYVFSRLPDMFNFFRRPAGDKSKLPVNPGYWGEKVQAEDKHSPVQEFSKSKFRRVINKIMYSSKLSKEARAEVKDQVLDRLDDCNGGHEAKAAAYHFSSGDFCFQDLWDYDFKEHSDRFLWCCYAVSYAVQEYDQQKVWAQKQTAKAIKLKTR